MTPTTPTPYAPDDPTLAPFAGRQKAFEFLYTRLTDPDGAGAALLIGQRDSGKTTLLRRCEGVFDESFIVVYYALQTKSLNHEADFLRLLVDGITAVLTVRDFTLSRLPDTPTPVTREWFADEFLREVLAILRHGRRLVLLLDDSSALLQAVDAAQLPADFFSWLDSLLTKYPDLGLVLGLDAAFEDEISRFGALVSLTNIFRLSSLALDETTWLMNASGRYSLTAEASIAVHHATGGQPRLAQRFGEALYQRWAGDQSRGLLNVDDVKAVMPKIYKYSEADFKDTWAGTTRNERLVLTAISSLLYADPLHPVTIATVENWLVETDYPLDSTAINAAVRGLEYREIITVTSAGLTISAGMMQTWLLDNARLGEGEASALPVNRPWLRWLVLAGVLALIALLIAIGGANTDAPTVEPAPTVTLLSSASE